jgi:Raf kinase inhibitor-like YbhB/YbcL family protein
MQTPAPGVTGPPRRSDVTTTTVAGMNTLVTSNLFTLTSSAFAPGDEIATLYTCDGEGAAPPLSWANVPPGTVELALTITDPDAGGYVHWVVAGIPATSKGIGPAALPAGTVELASSAGTNAYTPPCPPAGKSHSYDFTLYALSAPSGLTASSPTSDALIKLASEATAGGTTVLTGSYTRPNAN